MDVHEILDGCLLRRGAMRASVKTRATSAENLGSGKHRRRGSKVPGEHRLRAVGVNFT